MQEEANHIARDDPRAAAQVVMPIGAIVALLAAHPALGRAGRVHGTRELVIPDTPCIVPYRVHAAGIEILRVFHAHRRWPSSL